MNEFELWSMQREQAGREEERKRDLEKITKYLLNKSKQDGKPLTQEEAQKQALELIS